MLLFARIVIALVLIIRERASTHLLNETQDMKDSFVDGMKNDIVVHSRLLVSTVEYIKCVEKIGHAFEGGQGLGII